MPDQVRHDAQGTLIPCILHESEAFICKAFKGAAMVDLLQTLVHSTVLKNGPANMANGHLRERFWMKCFLPISNKSTRDNVYLRQVSQILL